MEKVKKCNRCNANVSLNKFYKERNNKDGLRNECKTCNNKTRAIYRKNNTKLLNKKHKEWRNSNKEYNLKRMQDWYLKNKRKKLDYVNNYHKQRKKTDPLFALKLSIRSAIASSFALKGYKKNTKAEKILGCDFIYFMKHIEKLFKPGMTWENRAEWHIDHIIPLVTAKTEEELIKLNHYTNLQPLWAHENLSKGAKICQK